MQTGDGCKILCLYPGSIPRFIRLCLEDMLNILGGAPVSLGNKGKEAIAFNSFSGNSEAKLLSCVFVEQGLNATIALGALGQVQRAPFLVDFVAQGLTLNSEDKNVMKTYSTTRFNTSVGIGPNTVHSDQMEWWGHTNGFLPAEMERILISPPAVMIIRGHALVSFMFEATRLFGARFRPSLNVVLQCEPVQVLEGSITA